MGILRTDRVSGLGGANAITGSVEFHGKESQDDLQLLPSSDFNFGTGDYTIEAWVYPVEFGRSQMIFAVHNADSTAAAGKFYLRSTNVFTYWSENAARITSSTTYTESKWYHVALVNNSGTTTLYVDGTSQGTTTYGNGFGSDSFVVHIGRNAANDNQSWNGFISNIRVTKGTALYTSTFTPPTTRLTKRSDTVLLACNSASNVLNEETGKVIQSVTASTNNSGPKASKFTPNSPVGFSTTTDVGSQYGTTFDGFGNFATSTYMVPPGGNTRERNRGRAVMPVGARSPYDSILGLDIQSEGNSQDFGDLRQEAQLPGTASSSTRMLVTMGYTSPASTNTIDFITIANIASSEDFGDLTEARRRTQSLSNSTRAVHVGGTGASPTPYFNTMDFNTIATLGNSTDFGDTNAASAAHGGSVASSTRGIYNPALVNSSYVNSLEFITIATTGNGQDFGDLSLAKGYYFRGSICDTTRGLFAGGYNPVQDTIEFVTMATTGNSTDFGNLTVARRGGGGTSNSIKSVFMGGYLPGVGNVIDSVIIQTTGDAKDFGDLAIRTHDTSASSDSHGGL